MQSCLSTKKGVRSKSYNSNKNKITKGRIFLSSMRWINGDIRKKGFSLIELLIG